MLQVPPFRREEGVPPFTPHTPKKTPKPNPAMSLEAYPDQVGLQGKQEGCVPFFLFVFAVGGGESPFGLEGKPKGDKRLV